MRKSSFVLTCWRLMPAVCIVVLLLPTALPHVPFSLIWLPLPWVAAYYWMMVTPDRLGIKTSFLIGLLQDALTGTPFGLNALSWLAFRFGVMQRRKSGIEEGFYVSWAQLALVLLVVLLLQCAGLGFITSSVPPLPQVLLTWMAAVLIYPATHAVLDIVDRLFVRKYWFILQHV